MNRPLAEALEVVTVTSDAGFAALKAAWNAVADQGVVPSVFLSHEWFDAAWAWRRLDATLELQVARSLGRIVGILPLIRSTKSQYRPRRLELLTVPDTQVSDLIAAPRDTANVENAFAMALAKRRDWDILQLNYLEPHGALIKGFIPALARHGLRHQTLDGGQNTLVDLVGTWEGYYEGRSRKLKKANNLVANRLKRAGDVRIERLTANACDESIFRTSLDAVIGISRRSWKSKTQNSLDQPGPQAFIRSLSEAARNRGWLSIWLLYIDNQPVAMEYQLVDRGKVHALRSDFDEVFKETSPGSYLFRQLLESSFGCGLQRYYMGPGENPYKKRWSDKGEPLQRVVAYNRTVRGRLTWLREAALKPVFRSLRDRFTKPEQAA